MEGLAAPEMGMLAITVTAATAVVVTPAVTTPSKLLQTCCSTMATPEDITPH
jgi:hypothetical protein